MTMPMILKNTMVKDLSVILSMTTMNYGKSSKDRPTSELNIMILKLMTTIIQSIMAMIITQCMMSMMNTIKMLSMKHFTRLVEKFVKSHYL